MTSEQWNTSTSLEELIDACGLREGVEGVEPTNNAAERSLRQAVIWRKLSFGTQSASGSRFVERMLSVIETCRQQKRDLFAWMVDAVQAHLAHQPAPSLISGA